MLPSTASRVRLSTHAEGSGSKALISASVPEFLVSELIEDVEGMETKNIEEYPPILRRIISEYAELFQERSKTHRIMTEMPEGNSQTLKTKRAEISDIIKSLSTEIDKSLTKAIGQLQNGKTTHFYSWGNFNLVRLIL